MPTDIELRLVANNQPAVQGIRQVASESQKLYTQNEKNQKREKGLIADIEQEMDRLREKRRNAFTETEITKYNQKLKEAEMHLKEYNDMGVKVEKQHAAMEAGTGRLGAAMLKLGTAIAAAFSIRKISDWVVATVKAYDVQIQAERKLLNALDGRDRIQKRLIAQAREIQSKTIFGDEEILNAQAFLAAEGRTEEQIKKTISAAVQLSTVMGIDLQSATQQLNQTYEGTIGRLGRLDGGLKGLTTEQLVHGQAVDLINSKYSGFAETVATVGVGSINQLKNAWGDLKEVYGSFFAEFMKQTGLADKMKEQMESTTDVLSDKNIPWVKRWLSFFGIGTKKVLEKVTEDELVNKANLSKTQKESNDEREEQNRKFWETIEAINQKGYDTTFDQFKREADRIYKEHLSELDRNGVAEFERLEKLEEARLKEVKAYEEFLEITEKANKENRERRKEDYDKFVEAYKKLGEARRNVFEEGGKAIEDFMSLLDELASREYDEAQRQRELTDTRIDQVQNELQIEAELMKAGYASNVEAKRKELEDLKKLRDKALADEEKAKKKAHALKVAELVAQKAVELSKVIMSYQVAKAEATAMMGNPVTLAPGIALLAAAKINQALSIAAISASVIAASLSKFKKGGWTGNGTVRDETGDKVAGIVHEREFVIRRGPANKFRGLLESINRDDRKGVLESFNKMRPELLGGTNIINVENTGPNRRLDEVNSNLRKIQSREERTIIGNKIIIRKGSTTRIITT